MSGLSEMTLQGWLVASNILIADRGGKGSHRNFVHPKVSQAVTLSGKPGADALAYQIKAVKTALKELEK